jgi:hypothetical protein
MLAGTGPSEIKQSKDDSAKSKFALNVEIIISPESIEKRVNMICVYVCVVFRRAIIYKKTPATPHNYVRSFSLLLSLSRNCYDFVYFRLFFRIINEFKLKCVASN